MSILLAVGSRDRAMLFLLGIANGNVSFRKMCINSISLEKNNHKLLVYGSRDIPILLLATALVRGTAVVVVVWSVI